MPAASCLTNRMRSWSVSVSPRVLIRSRSVPTSASCEREEETGGERADPGWERKGSIAREREGAVAWEGLGYLHDKNEHRGVFRACSERSDDVRVRQPAHHPGERSRWAALDSSQLADTRAGKPRQPCGVGQVS